LSSRPPLLSPLFLLCFAANLVQATAFSLFVHFPGFLHELGAAPTLIGVVMALGAATAVAGAPLVGRALDARGRRAVVLAGSALNIVTCAGFLFVDRLGVSELDASFTVTLDQRLAALLRARLTQATGRATRAAPTD